MKQHILEVEELLIKYPDGFSMGPVSFALEPGEILAVIGESGSGKSTLAKAVVNLLPACHSQKSGRVVINGKEILDESEKSLRPLRMKEFSIVMQNSQELLNPSTTLRDQLYEVLPRSCSRSERAVELMCRVGLCETDMERYPNQLSGGMVQRFLLAVSIAQNPAVIVLDEPTSALDEEARVAFIRLIREIQREQGTAFLLVTHDLLLARQLSDRVLVLYRGTEVETGVTQELLQHPCHPYTRGLIGASMELYPLRDVWGIRRGMDERGNGCPFFGRCTQSIEVCARELPRLAEVNSMDNRILRCHRGGVVAMLEGTGISKAYGKQRVLVSSDVVVYSGETVALIGQSGSGKSTYAEILAGFAEADDGCLFFEGAPADYRKLHRMEGGLQIVFQDSERALNQNMMVTEVVEEPLILSGMLDKHEIRKRMWDLLEAVGLPADEAFISQKVQKLSGGQKQRICIARALMLRPRVLIADEPTAMLDVSSKANLLRMLKGLQNDRGFSMLMVTHDLACAEKIADRIYRMEGGRCLLRAQTGFDNKCRKLYDENETKF